MLGRYLVLFREIGDGPRHPQHPVVPPSREPHPVHSPREEYLRITPQRAHLAQPTSGEHGVGRALTPGLYLARLGDPLPDESGTFRRLLIAQFLACEAWDVDEDVHPVEQGTRDACLVTFDLSGRASARPPLITRVP